MPKQSAAKAMPQKSKFTKEDYLRIEQRSAKYKAADIQCVRAIAQAAINLELFTIPLYMTSMYSIFGMHEINSKGSTLYTGRKWPGSAPMPSLSGPKTPIPLTVNEKVFNQVYSVFIDEMLHLQLASNMASRLNIKPCFTSPALVDQEYGWRCYDEQRQLPHILEFEDWKGKSLNKNTTVALRALNQEQIELFCAIEETAHSAEENLNNPEIIVPGGSGEKRKKYFESAPFDWFTEDMNEKDLPWFGSIGHMYLCYWDYLEIQYDDGSQLLEYLLSSSYQRDQFNNVADAKQYPGIATTLNMEIDALKIELQNNINAITDQGEGHDVAHLILEKWGHKRWALQYLNQNKKANKNLKDVRKPFQPDAEALMKRYPGYNDKGEPIYISGLASARIDSGDQDHFEIFTKVSEQIKDKQFKTWDQWHQENPNNPWTADMLGSSDGRAILPSRQMVANALNRLNTPEKKKNTYDTLSLSAVGTIKGLTTSLNRYWNQTNEEFPSPAMGGSGDRISICWAVTGQAPNLVQGITSQQADKLYHACQGMDYTATTPGKNTCAQVTTYHSCKGSNECKAQGGCGFVQSASGGGNCSQSGGTSTGLKSAPADNLCGQFGGCAVPISASQLYPDSGQMQLYSYDLSTPNHTAKKIKWPEMHARDMLPPTVVYSDSMPYKAGEPVYKAAWQAFCAAKGLIKVEKKITKEEIVIPDEPTPSDIRLALPPST